MENHHSAKDASNQESHPRLSPQNLFRLAAILSGNRDREVFNVTKAKLGRNSQTTFYIPSFPNAPATNKTDRA
jgi:hypothetical protein